MKTRQNKYSIRKFSVGASSILIAALLFMGGGVAQAAEHNQESGTPEKATAQSIGDENKDNGQQTTQENTSQTTQQTTSEKPNNENDHSENTNDSQTSLHNENNENVEHTNTQTTDNKVTQNNQEAQSTEEQNHNQSNSNPSKNVDATQNHVQSNKDTQLNNQSNDAKQNDSNSKKIDDQIQSSEPTSQNQTIQSKTDTKQDQEDSQSLTQRKNAQPNNEGMQSTSNAQQTDQNLKESDKNMTDKEKTQPDQTTGVQNKDNIKSDQSSNDVQQTAPSTKPEAIQHEKPSVVNHNQKLSAQDKSSTQSTTNQSLNSKAQLLNVSDKANPSSNNDQSSNNNKNSKDGIETLTNNAVATTNKQSSQQSTEQNKDQTNKVAKQGQYKNHDPIILVHGFNGFTDDINPAVLSHYWGGDKMNIRQDLEENGYESYEASISAFGSNYDRAVELYYYIKGGTVDYGAAHAAKYGHARYGKTYEGVYKDWQTGQKVHLVGHSMGGQTIRQLEELLRNGSPEEIEYQKEHGGDISPLFQGNHDNMISSITTLGTPHNGTHASDELGNEALIRQVVYDLGKTYGNKNSRVDFGLSQWGLKQQPNESYIHYVKRVKNSNLWKSKDNGFYDLTRDGATDLNRKTSLNPNIVYKTYTGEATHESLDGRQKADANLYLPFTVTANIIGKAKEKEWRENDGLVSVVSAQHPFNQNYVEATDQNQKGVWQVTPTKHDWDHVDFVGQDSSDTVRSREELQQFWHDLADDLVQSEKLTSTDNS